MVSYVGCRDCHGANLRGGGGGLTPAGPNLAVVTGWTQDQFITTMRTGVDPGGHALDPRQMPGVGGIAATRTILHTSPSLRILVVTLFEDDESVFTALRAGARGYVLKDADEDEMVRAIQAVGRGEAIFSPAIATRLMDFFAAPHPAVPKEVFPTLTEREREVLGLIAQGHANAVIARQLSLSPKTVHNYVSNIFSKLQVADRAQAIIRAREAGLGEAPKQR
ncbi:MAG: LuxR C-terminal-related transcriptional regulator [Anaerolineae bacterium]